MKTYRVGICDTDIEYATSLMDFINMQESSILANAFTGIEAIDKYLVANDLDLILIDDSLKGQLKECISTIGDIRTMYLTEQRDTSGFDDFESMEEQTNVRERIYIYKYQRADHIVRMVRDGLTMELRSARQVVRSIAVFSPIGRCGKTRLAKAFALSDEVRGGLYIAMENYGIKNESLNNSFLYLLKTKSQSLDEELERLIVDENGFKSIYPSGSYMDLRDVDRSDIEELIRVLVKTGRFSTIVFDIGSAAFEDLSILECFDQIYVPILKDNESSAKLETCMRLFRDLGLRQLISRMNKIIVPDCDYDSGEMTRLLWSQGGEEQ